MKDIEKIGFYSDFYFNGKKLSELGGVILNSSKPFLPQRESVTSTAIGVDGEIFYGIKTGVIEFTETIFFKDLEEITTLKNWLGVKQPSEFCYVGDDYKINCVVTGTQELDIYSYNKKFCGILEITFTAYDPHYYKIKRGDKK